MNLHCGQQRVSNNNGKQNQNVADRNHAVEIYKPETEEFLKTTEAGTEHSPPDIIRYHSSLVSINNINSETGRINEDILQSLEMRISACF